MATKGEYRVGIDFNPGGDARVGDIKTIAARFIDLIEEIPAIDKPHYPEISRLKALAQTHVEDAAMWAVKAVTKRPQG